MRLTRTSLIVVSSIVLAAAFIAVVQVEAQGDGRLPQTPAAPVGTGFTYQGHLKQNGVAVNATCDMAFRLYDALASGAQVGSPITTTVPVASGLFTVVLDFGASTFTGEARWLQIAARCPTGSGTYTTLSPRQALAATPYALSLKPNATITGLTNLGIESFGSATRQMLNLWGTQYGIGIQGYTQYYRVDSGAGFGWYQGGSHVDAAGNPGPGGKTLMSLDSSGVLSVTNGIKSFSVTGDGVTGISSSGSGVYGENTTGGFAGYFSGNVYVKGTLSKFAGAFKIDHPLDPTNKYLQHSFVESPDMMNVYNGNITTDAQGEATVMLPDYFEALNQDFRYQLTVIGQFAHAMVATEIQNNRFTIKTDKPSVKVSWQVTGIRHDPYANDHRIQVEVNKPADWHGLYLYPQGYGQPAAKSIAGQVGAAADDGTK